MQETKKSHYVVPSWNHLYIITSGKKGVNEEDENGDKKGKKGKRVTLSMGKRT